jgi:hypothetical protein
VIELATLVSLAIRIEPEVLRAIRLKLAPHLNAGAEADLWFSPLVQSRGPDGIVFLPEVADILRERLKGEQSLSRRERLKGEQRLSRVGEIIQKYHEKTSPAIWLEEKVTWFALSTQSKLQLEIDNELNTALVALVMEGRTGLAHWAARALPRLPLAARRSKAAWMLSLAVSKYLEDRFSLQGKPPDDLLETDLRDLLPDLPDIELGIRRVENILELGDMDPEDTYTIRVADTEPRLVEICWEAENKAQREVVGVMSGEVYRRNVGLGLVRLRNARGTVYELRPIQVVTDDLVNDRDAQQNKIPIGPAPSTGLGKRRSAMISSTSVDLPEHRQQAIDACLRQGIFPLAIEHLPSRDADAIRVSLEMVDKADIYIGIYGWRYSHVLAEHDISIALRYGHVPTGHDISITEMEFNRAVERGIPILVFTIHQDHPLTITMVETDKDAQEKLKQLKERAYHGRGRLEFKSPEELRSHIIQSLGALLKEEEAASQEKRAPSLHPPNLIPAAPAPYIAHPYSLLQTRDVVGRREELRLLTDWVTVNTTVPRDVRLFNVVAIGGMGKSALTWKWFNDIAPNELPHLTGRMWWSFYESDAYFENFVIRALAYAAGLSEAEVRQIPAQEREDRLWHIFDQRPFLLVLDGLERILLAYARMDAAHLPDDNLDEQTANNIAQFYGLPDNVQETDLEKHRLRQCTDPRAGHFLRRLAQVRASRLLISTRLYPAELQTHTAQPRPGCYPLFLTGLGDDDALALWRALIGGTHSGTREQLLPLFRSFGNYPLLLRALAGEVAGYRPAPGDFDRWRQAHADFNPVELPLQNARTHVLAFALQGLSAAAAPGPPHHRRIPHASHVGDAACSASRRREGETMSGRPRAGRYADGVGRPRPGRLGQGREPLRPASHCAWRGMAGAECPRPAGYLRRTA